MGWGSAFTSAWNKASDAVQQKVAQVATTAKQVTNQVVAKAQNVAQNVTQQAQKAANFISQQTAKAVQPVKKAVVNAVNTAKQVVTNQVNQAVEKAKQSIPIIAEAAKQTIELAKQEAKRITEEAKQSFNKAKDTVKQKAVAFSKKVKKTFKKIKKHFSDLNKLNKPIEQCPYGRFLYTNVEDTSKEKKLKLKGEAALYKFKKETHNSATEISVISGQAGMDGTRISAEASAFKLTQTFQTGDDPLNPTDRVDAEIKLASVEAKGDFLVGYDTKRAGIAIGGSLGADLVSANVKHEKNIPIPFTNWSISIRTSKDIPLPTPIPDGVGIGGGGQAYWDLEEKRFHLGAFAKGKILKGIGAGLDISIGQKYTTRERRADW